MQKFYRSEYPGEFVITSTTFRGGKKIQEREWIDNPIENKSLNNRALCLALGPSHTQLPMVRIEKHRGDLLGRNRMQMYAIDDYWKMLKPDFLIVLDQPRLDEIKEEGFQKDNIVYTSAALCIRNPGEFYLIPHGVKYLPEVTSVWLACFDGHKDIYLYGYDIYDANGKEQLKMIEYIKQIMETFNDVTFYHVSDDATPEQWKRCINCTMMSVREFVCECDI